MIQSLRAFGRLVTVVRVVLRHDLDGALPKQPWWWRVCRVPLGWWPQRAASVHAHWGERLRLALIELGPIFIKFGQALATRYDVVGAEAAQALSMLQDRVPPIEGGWGKARCRALLGEAAFHDAFSSFDATPLAAASMAQVHAATLMTGESVVVKLLRPAILQQVSRDVRWMRFLAKWGQRLSGWGKRLRLVDVVEEFARFTYDELDLRREAANASQMRRSFRHSWSLIIPRIHWAWCRQQMMVMARISGIPIGDVEALQQHGVDMRRLAERGVEIFFTQILRDRFFHADMHPGNIFVDVTNPADPRYIAIDFGIVGMLTEHDQRYLAENLLAFFEQDYARVAQLHVRSGWVPPGTDVLAFESLIRTVCEPMFEQPLKDLSLGRLLFDLLQAAKQFDMVVQPQLILLQKTLLSVEGLGRRLYPELDLWSTAKPMVATWLKEQMGVKAFIQKLTTHGPRLATHLLDSLIEGQST